MSDERKSVDRREFLRKAAITGAAAAWAVPAIQTVAATPAFAQTSGTPVEGDHSRCVAACNEAGGGCGDGADGGANPGGCAGSTPVGGVCNRQCCVLCPPGGVCCNPALVNQSGWTSTCTPKTTSLVGC